MDLDLMPYPSLKSILLLGEHWSCVELREAQWKLREAEVELGEAESLNDR